MMKRISRRLIGCLLALSLTLTGASVLSSCSQDDKGTETTAPTTTAEVTEESASAVTSETTAPETTVPPVETVTLNFSSDVPGAEPTVLKIEKTAPTVRLPEDPTREGYAFKGWYTEKDGKGERVTVATALTGDATYYAAWRPYMDMSDRNQIKIGGFNGITEDRAVESDFAALAECGVDEIYMTFFHDDSEDGRYSLAKSLQYIEWMEKYGIRSWINDFKLNELLSKHAPAEEIYALLDVYRNSPAFAGNYLVDEPAGSQFDSLLSTVTYYKELMPDHEMYINLLPNIAPSSAFIDNRFDRYIGDFVERFPLSYVSQDFYPIEIVNGKKVISRHYYESLYTSAVAARDAGKEHWMYVYTMRDTVNPSRDYEPSLNDVRYEVFTAMAYGCNSIAYFCFDCPPSYSKSESFGMMKNHEKTPLFDVGKQVTAEIKALSDCFPGYLWQDVYYYATDGRFERVVKQTMSSIDKQDSIGVQADNDMLIGRFDEANGDGEAFMFVNHSNPNAYADVHVDLTVVGAAQVTLHIGTETTTLTADAEGVYHFTLAPGQGGFVEIDR